MDIKQFKQNIVFSRFYLNNENWCANFKEVKLIVSYNNQFENIRKISQNHCVRA